MYISKRTHIISTLYLYICFFEKNNIYHIKYISYKNIYIILRTYVYIYIIHICKHVYHIYIYQINIYIYIIYIMYIIFLLNQINHI